MITVFHYGCEFSTCDANKSIKSFRIGTRWILIQPFGFGCKHCNLLDVCMCVHCAKERGEKNGNVTFSHYSKYVTSIYEESGWIASYFWWWFESQMNEANLNLKSSFCWNGVPYDYCISSASNQRKKIRGHLHPHHLRRQITYKCWSQIEIIWCNVTYRSTCCSVSAVISHQNATNTERTPFSLAKIWNRLLPTNAYVSNDKTETERKR